VHFRPDVSQIQEAMIIFQCQLMDTLEQIQNEDKRKELNKDAVQEWFNYKYLQRIYIKGIL